MRSAEDRRKALFALALAALVAGAGAIALVHRDAPVAGPGAPRLHGVPDPHQGRRQAGAGRDGMLGATRSAERFARAYLRYEAGTLTSAGRRALARFSTPQLGGQLLRAPVRIAPGGRAPRQRVLRVASTRVGVFDGKPALLLGVLIAGSDGSHLLGLSAIEQGGRWLIAGVGP
jgi:hypothetical protein